jgi:hypothetical protein
MARRSPTRAARARPAASRPRVHPHDPPPAAAARALKDVQGEADQTNIEYDDPSDPFGNLQMGLLWNSTRVTVDPTADQLLQQLRQPRDVSGTLTQKRMRIPWLVPVRAGALEFDLLIVHLKSGGDPPQAAEVEALKTFIVARQSAPNARHLIVLGDWNIRPDQATGRARLRQMMAPACCRSRTLQGPKRCSGT